MTTFHGMRNLASELDYRDGNKKERFERSKAEILTAYKEKISVGQPMDGISELGGLDRQLLQSSEFYFVGTSALRKVTPEEETDDSITDLSWIPEPIKKTLLRMELEDISTGSFLSVLRRVKDDPMALVWLTLPESQALWIESSNHDALSIAERGFDTINDTSPGEDEDPLDMGYETERENSEEDSEEKEPSPQKVKRTIRKEFRPPRDRYRLADRHRHNPNAEAKEKRHYDLKGDIENIQELRSIESIEDYLKLLRRDYEKDLVLWREWSQGRKAQDRELYLQLMKARGLDLETIRAKLWACFDREPGKIAEGEETRRPLKARWFEGDNYNPETHEVNEEYQMTNEEIEELSRRLGRDVSTVETKFRFIKPCIWEIERSRALRELHHTKSQWNIIYQKVWDALGASLIGRARVADSESKKNFVRLKTAKWQYRLSQDVKKEIAAALAEKQNRR